MFLLINWFKNLFKPIPQLPNEEDKYSRIRKQIEELAALAHQFNKEAEALQIQRDEATQQIKRLYTVLAWIKMNNVNGPELVERAFSEIEQLHHEIH